MGVCSQFGKHTTTNIRCMAEKYYAVRDYKIKEDRTSL